MFELKSKLSDNKLEIDTATMGLLKTVMYHTGITEPIIKRFETSSKEVIGEKIAKEIALRLEEKALPALVSGVLVERKIVDRGRLKTVVGPVELPDLIMLKAFILFCQYNAPFEIH